MKDEGEAQSNATKITQRKHFFFPVFKTKATWTLILHFGLRGSGFTMPVGKAKMSPLQGCETQGLCLGDEQGSQIPTRHI